MTFYLPTDATSYTFSVNQPNLNDTYTLQLTSRYNKNTFEWSLTVEETNDRYTSFTMTLSSDDTEGHYNGVYDYQIEDSLDNVVVSGLLKWINEDGGSMDTVSYISDNEDRGAVQFYRP